MSTFEIGDRVRKIDGYPFVGEVVATYPGEDKCSVRHKDGWDHIFRDRQLAPNLDEYQYLDLLRDCLENGVYREGRNGGTYGLFGRQIRFDLQKGFPLLTTKKLFTKAIIVELLWFLRGDTNIEYLHDYGVTIWDEWADEKGDLGPVYGAQWRSWPNPYDIEFEQVGEFELMQMGTIDQITDVIESLSVDPNSRRHIVTAWNPPLIGEMALPPCHCLFQFFVADDKLSCQLYQRSADVFLGVPFNIASYALLTHMIAREVGLEVGEFIHTFGDVHLYANHVDQAREQLSRVPRTPPGLIIDSDAPIFGVTPGEIQFHNYNPHPTIQAEVSV